MNTKESRHDYLVLSRGQWDKAASKKEIQTAIDQFYLWLTRCIDEGKMKMGSRLANAGATVSKTGIATDGPFGEAKEVIGGYWWIVAGNLEEAAQIAAENPYLKYGIVSEIRTLDPELASAYSQAVEMTVLKTENATPARSDFDLRLQFSVSAEALFTALGTLEGVKSWWTRFCDVSEDIGGQSSFRFPGAGFHAVMKILKRKSPQLLEWECIDSKHADDTGYADLHDWVGTRVRFEIRDLGDARSQLDFTHFRLRELECLESCTGGWSFFLNQSLRGYLENGQGEPWSKES